MKVQGEWYPFLITMCHVLRTRISLPPLTYCLPNTFHVKTFIGTLRLTLKILGIFLLGIRDEQMDDLFLVTYMKHPVNFSTISTGCVCVCVCVCV